MYRRPLFVLAVILLLATAYTLRPGGLLRDAVTAVDAAAGGRPGGKPSASARATAPMLESPRATKLVAAPRGLIAHRLVYSQAWPGELPPTMAVFRTWTESFLTASLNRRADLAAEGVRLAHERRSTMREMIKADPQRALDVTVPMSVRSLLPAEVQAELETRVAGTGDLALQCALAANGAADAAQPIVSLRGVTYAAHLYGRRAGQPTKYGASLHGVALDGELAVHESPLRMIEAGEALAASRAQIDPLTRAEVVAPAAWVEVHGRAWPLADSSTTTTTTEAVDARLVRAEQGPGPRVLPLLMDESAAVTEQAAESIFAWSMGTKQVLMLRVDFSDRSGEPVSATDASFVMSQVATFFAESSYGKTALTTTVTRQLYRMPRTAATYAATANYQQLYTDAASAAALDYDLTKYDRVVLVFNSPASILGSLSTGERAAGRADVRGSRVWIEATSFARSVLIHELGHTYGAEHANLWRVGDNNPISPSGFSQEYGDSFDPMGAYPTVDVVARFDFNMWEKHRFGWLPESQVLSVTKSGTYRVYRFDHAGAAEVNQPLALRVFRDGARSYWIGLRQNFDTSAAYVVWGQSDFEPTRLLQLGSVTNNATAALLPIGRTFSDPAYGITIKPVGKGGNFPGYYLELEITLPATPPNVIARWGAWDSRMFFPTELPQVSALANDGFLSVALLRDGTVRGWDLSAPLAIPAGVSAVRSVAAAIGIFGVVKSDGSVQLWSYYPGGQPTTPPAGLAGVRQLAIGGGGGTLVGDSSAHVLALKEDGTVVAWGSNYTGQLAVPASLRDVVEIAATDGTSIAVRSDGTMVQWGRDLGFNVSRLPFPQRATGVVSVVSHTLARHALALKFDGTVLAWGENEDGQCNVPAGLAGVVAVAVGPTYSLALKADGTIAAWGSNIYGQLNLPSMPRVTGLAAGAWASYALLGSRTFITAQPKSQLVLSGGSATFNVAVNAVSTPSYQWRKDGVAIPGATTPSLTFTGLASSHSGRYDVIVSGDGFPIVSHFARLDVLTPIVLASQPFSQTLLNGTAAELNVSATGGGTITYQWRKNGVPISGANNPQLLLSNLTPDASGKYDVVLTDGLSTVTSNAAVIQVNLITHLSNLSVLTTLFPFESFTLGFVVGGPGTSELQRKSTLIRAMGPSLASFGVPDVMSDPKLEIFTGGANPAFNDNWGGSAAINSVVVGVGAFPFTSPGSLDAGWQEFFGNQAYSVRISGSGSSSGAVLGELYDATSYAFVPTTPRFINASVLKPLRTGLTAGFSIAGTLPMKVLLRVVGPTLATAPFNVPGVVADPQLTVYNDHSTVIGLNNDWGGSAELAGIFTSVGAFQLPAGSKDAAILLTLAPGSYTVLASGVGGTTGTALVEIYEVR